jgi:hypothetical protein
MKPDFDAADALHFGGGFQHALHQLLWFAVTIEQVDRTLIFRATKENFECLKVFANFVRSSLIGFDLDNRVVVLEDARIVYKEIRLLIADTELL